MGDGRFYLSGYVNVYRGHNGLFYKHFYDSYAEANAGDRTMHEETGRRRWKCVKVVSVKPDVNTEACYG